jgi:phosphatidylglycerol:prolipoprotein diacylglycerol transferase
MEHAAWLHHLDPFIIQFSESFGVRWYGMAYLAGFVIGGLFMFFIVSRGRRTLKPEMIIDLVTYIVLGTMIGGRLGYALFYSPELFTDFSMQFPYWGVLRVWEGGMASHGGIIGIMVACAIFARRHKLSFLHLGDLTVLGACFGIFFGRIANFINGELFGRPASASLPWAVKFPGEMYLWLKHDAEKVITSTEPDLLANLKDAVGQIGISPEQWMAWVRQVRTDMFARHEIQEAIEKLILAVQKGNVAVQGALAQVLTPRHPSQLYEAALEGALLFAIVFWFWRKPRKPGQAGALWLTLYAVVRIIGEQFRMPDAHIGFQLLGLTRGQWLSIAQLVVSALFLVWVSRRRVEVIAGWGPEAQMLRAQEEKTLKKP